MGIITQSANESSRTSTSKKIGIITLEDILEEILLQEEHEDSEVHENKVELARTREKLVLLFSDS